MNTILIDVLTYSIIIAFVLFITGILFIHNTYRYNKIIISIFCILSAFIIIYYDNKYTSEHTSHHWYIAHTYFINLLNIKQQQLQMAKLKWILF